MNLTRVAIAFLIAAGVILSGCGGGGGGVLAAVGNGGGIGGTGITSNGTIDGFGSIFVNGVEFETDDSEVSLDGVKMGADSLRLGMVVTVRGTVNNDGKTGTANEVIFDNEVQGPVTAIQVSKDGDSLLLKVFGIEIIAERTATVFDGVRFETLAVDDLVEVSGFFEKGLQLRATRIEKKSTFVAGASEVTLKGIVSGLSANLFKLGEYTVDSSNADLSNIPGGSLTDGLRVKVHGTLEGNNIQADRIEKDDSFIDSLGEEDELSVQGAISNFVDAAHFDVNGVAVDASNASLEPANLVLANGVIVSAEGTWNGTVLVAKEIESRRGRIELEAKVASVDAAAKTVTLQYFTGTVTVQVDSTTMLKDDSGQANPLTLAAIVSGDFLEVEAIKLGNDLLASRIHRDSQHDSILQAPVERFNAGADITLLGITFSTTGAVFESQNDSELSAEAFFVALQIGDLVRIRDEDLPDGIADEVEFEQGDALNGEEFEDDDCDNGGVGADNDCESEDDSTDDECDHGAAGANDDCQSEDDSSDDECDNGEAGTNNDCKSEDDTSDDECDKDGASSTDGCESGQEDPEDPEDPEDDL
jgi:hypothetical protein